MSNAPTPAKTLSNKIKIEKDNKIYNLEISYDEKEITLKIKIEKPLKIYEMKYSKNDLEKISKIFKGCDNLNEIYTYILNSLENKQYDFDITEEAIKIKLKNISIFEFKEMIIPEKEIDISEKINNLYTIQEELLKEIKELKIENDNLKKEIQLKNNKGEENELINVELKNGSNYGSGHRKFQVNKTKNNIVKISGLINCTLNQTICTLPENCRPKERLIFVCWSSNGPMRVDVCSNGNIHPFGSGNVWLSLDNITFIADF